MSIKELVDRIVEDGVLTRDEYQEFFLDVREDKVVDPEESVQIKRIQSMIDNGALKVE